MTEDQKTTHSIELKLTELSTSFTDFIDSSTKSDKEIIKRQDHTNGSVAEAQIDIAKMKTVATIFRVLAAMVIIPSLGYLLCDFISNKEEMVTIREHLTYVEEQQDSMEEDQKTINTFLTNYLSE